VRHASAAGRPNAERVAAALEAEDFGVQMVSPSLLHPLPAATLLPLLLPNERVAIVGEAPLDTGGFGAELGAALVEHGYRRRFKRFAPPPVPIPAARSLEAQVLPDDSRLSDRLASFLMDAEHAMATPLHTPA
jgi:pyruvate/2-oxoglutarate/acetoin dehydrogenase E1 component